MPDNANEILQRLTRVETKLDLMNATRDIAQEAQQSVKSAHHRIEELRDEIAAVKQSQRWLIGVAVSTAGVAITAAGLLLKGVSG